jgi:tetratricopeptide (TPR) repeat protein
MTLKSGLSLAVFTAFFLWVIMATMPYRLAVIEKAKLNDRTGQLSGEEYSLLSELKNVTAGTEKSLELNQRLGVVYWQEKKLQEAESMLRAVYDQRKINRDDRNYDQKFVSVAQDLGGLYRDLGRFADAGTIYQTLLSYDQSMCKNDDSRIARDCTNIGVIQYFNGLATEDGPLRQSLYTQSIDVLTKAAGIYKQLYGADSQELGNTLATESLVLRDSGRASDSVKAKAEAARIRALIKTPCTLP